MSGKMPEKKIVKKKWKKISHMGNAWCGSANSWISTAFSRPKIGEFFFASGSATNKNSTNSFWLVEDG